jgi:hypothetical protein
VGDVLNQAFLTLDEAVAMPALRTTADVVLPFNSRPKVKCGQVRVKIGKSGARGLSCPT